MKRTILTASLSMLLTGGVLLAQQPTPAPDAQQPPPPMHQHHAPSPEHQAKHLSKILNLTPDQTAKLEPILASRDQQMKAIQANGQLTQADARQQMRALHQSTEQQLAGVLSPDQLQQMKAMHHEHGPHGPHGGPNHGQPQTPPPAA
jgi:Spy/CpxP family protein refolding chaperone